VGEDVTKRVSEEGAARPLAGRHIAITRPPRQASALAGQLEAMGARVTPLAAIEIEPSADTSRLDAALGQLATYDWIAFTSVNGLEAFAGRLAARGSDWAARGLARVAAIGPATARALERRGVRVDAIPEEYVAEALAEALGNVAGQRILLPRADIAREALANTLRLRGAEVTEIAAYRTVVRPLAAELLARTLGSDRVDAITFTSSSTVRSLVAGLRAAGREPREALDGITLAAIGPITAETLRAEGLAPGLVAEEYTIPGLVRALVKHFGRADIVG
jgi:uroporphyrinogen III methyltransferase / synthase